MDKNDLDVKTVSEALRRVIEPMIDKRLNDLLDEAYYYMRRSYEEPASSLYYQAICTGILHGAAIVLGVDVDTITGIYNNFVMEVEKGLRKESTAT